MAPSLEEPIQMNLSAPLVSAPQLVAPEPGMIYLKDRKRRLAPQTHFDTNSDKNSRTLPWP